MIGQCTACGRYMTADLPDCDWLPELYCEDCRRPGERGDLEEVPDALIDTGVETLVAWDLEINQVESDPVEEVIL